MLEIFTASTREALRDSDLFGRLGGEEFAALLYDTNSETALVVAERIRESFAAATSEVDGNVVGATVSIGIAHCEGAVLEVPELLAQADRALYFAKERGRNRVEVASLDLLRAANTRKLAVVARLAA